MRRCSLTIAVRLAGVIALAVAALNEAKAQQGLPASPQNAGASPAVENNGQDFTRPETLFQLRYFYQTAPGSGAIPDDWKLRGQAAGRQHLTTGEVHDLFADAD